MHRSEGVDSEDGVAGVVRRVERGARRDRRSGCGSACVDAGGCTSRSLLGGRDGSGAGRAGDGAAIGTVPSVASGAAGRPRGDGCAGGGGGITGDISVRGVELLAGSFGASFAERNRAHPAVYSSIVDGGAGPHDLIRGEPHGSTSGGRSAAARRRQNASCATVWSSARACALE